jgi:hypothetical protein
MKLTNIQQLTHRFFRLGCGVLSLSVLGLVDSHGVLVAQWGENFAVDLELSLTISETATGTADIVTEDFAPFSVGVGLQEDLNSSIPLNLDVALGKFGIGSLTNLPVVPPVPLLNSDRFGMTIDYSSGLLPDSNGGFFEVFAELSFPNFGQTAVGSDTATQARVRVLRIGQRDGPQAPPIPVEDNPFLIGPVHRIGPAPSDVIDVDNPGDASVAMGTTFYQAYAGVPEPTFALAFTALGAVLFLRRKR